MNIDTLIDSIDFNKLAELDVLSINNELYKEAGMAGVAKGVANGVVGAAEHGLNIGHKALTSKPGKFLFKANLPIAALASAPTLMGMAKGTISKSEALKDTATNLVPGGTSFKAAVDGVKRSLTGMSEDSTKVANLELDELLKIASEELEKEASNTDKAKDIALGTGLAAGATAGTYYGGKAVIDFLDERQLLTNIDQGANKAMDTVGKGVANAMTRGKTGASIIKNIVNSGAKTLNDPRGRNIRTDWSTVAEKPDFKLAGKNLAKYLALIGGTTILTDVAADKIQDEYNQLITHMHTGRIASDADVELEKFAFDFFLNKEALELPNPEMYHDNKAGKRLLYERLDQPIKTTGTFLLSLGLLSSLVGRNLYGGFEKIDKNTQDQKRVIVDIPKKEAFIDDIDSVEKLAEFVEGLNKEAINLGQAKFKIDEAVAKYNGPGSKGLHKYQEFLQAGGSKQYAYDGPKGLGHELLETVPFKAVEGLAYASPMVAVAMLTGRNAKRGFSPIIEDPTAPPIAPGMERIIIQEGPKKEEKKASSEDDEDLHTFAADFVGLEKEALNAWKQHWAEMSEDNKNVIRQEGLIDHQKILDGLNRGSANIVAKDPRMEVTHLGTKDFERTFARNIRKDLNPGHNTIKNRKTQRQASKMIAENMERGGGGYTYYNAPNNKIYINAPNNDVGQMKNNLFNVDTLTKNEEAPKTLKDRILGRTRYHDVLVGKEKSLDQKLSEAVILRHEVDEARAYARALDKHPDHLAYNEVLKSPVGARTAWAGHLNPSVPIRESANLALLPDKVKDIFKDVRTNATGEAYHIPQYANNPVLNKKLIKSMEKTLLSWYR